MVFPAAAPSKRACERTLPPSPTRIASCRRRRRRLRSLPPASREGSQRVDSATKLGLAYIAGARAPARLRHERAAGNPSAEYSHHGTMLIVKKLGELNHENIR